jgi:cAMP phosphodiesterase
MLKILNVKKRKKKEKAITDYLKEHKKKRKKKQYLYNILLRQYLVTKCKSTHIGGYVCKSTHIGGLKILV